VKKSQYLFKLEGRPENHETGNKARALRFLEKHGYRIPRTWVISSRALADFTILGESVFEQLRHEIAGLGDLNYAVRSSTNLEDSGNHSFAGQFQTVINVRGTSRILDAVKEIWMSADSYRNSEYHSRVSANSDAPTCAVIIQEMVDSKLSGVSFSKNPVTNLNEIVVEAIEGLGEDLVQKGVKPLRWRIKGEFLLEGDDSFKFFAIIRTVAAATRKLKRSYGTHVDIEWAFDGKNLYFLQIRSITGTGQIPVYSNKMAREMLPGQIKPLVWSVNIPLVNGTWIELLTEITGPLALQPEDLARSFYYRTYFNMAALGEVFSKFGLPVESLEFMFLSEQGKMPKMMPGLKTFRHTFRMIRFGYSKLYFAPTFLKRYKSLTMRVEQLRKEIRSDFSIQNYPALFNELFSEARKIAYLNIVIPLLMQLFNKRLRNKLKKHGVDYDMIDFTSDFPLLAELSPVQAMDRLRQAYGNLPEASRIDGGSVHDLYNDPGAGDFCVEFDRFMTEFGHLSESGNDFSVPKWEENPDFVLSMILQSGGQAPNKKLVPFSELRLPGTDKASLRRLYGRAGKFRVYREQVSSLYIRGYGLFRTLFLQLGQEFASMGILDDLSDLFYLTRREIDEILTLPGLAAGPEYRQLVLERKKEMAETRDLLLPTIIFGDHAPLVERGRFKNITGVGASPGLYRGMTRVVRGSADFSSVNRGDVLLIPFSDVSWTPVLVKAGAIVSEAGGMLSHCSIIARELGIPALVSVENACAIAEDLDVTVDGSNGLLTINGYE
jgi:phosphohistidine swiveling domain-containing protein